MRKAILLLLALLLLFPSGLFAGSSTSSETTNKNDMEDKYPELVPEPYNPAEYPSWVKKTRRAVVVFVGSYPLSIFFTKLGLDLYDWGSHNFSSDYTPSIAGGGGSKSRGMDADEMKRVSIAALCVSGMVTLADFIIQEIKENKKAKALDKKWKK